MWPFQKKKNKTRSYSEREQFGNFNPYLKEERTNSGRQITRVTKYFTLLPIIFGSSVWNLLRVTLLAAGILKLFLDFWKICGHLR